MIKGKCKCYLDRYKVRWPEAFVAVPKRGSRVMSLDGKYLLRVNDIAHGISLETGEPEIIIELMENLER